MEVAAAATATTTGSNIARERRCADDGQCSTIVDRTGGAAAIGAGAIKSRTATAAADGLAKKHAGAVAARGVRIASATGATA